MDKSDSITSLATSLSALQSELKPVVRDSINPFFKSKYADLSSIWETIRPLLTKHRFAISQLPQVQEGQIVLTTLLLHETGEWLSSDLLVTPSKLNDPQAVGSALTYARRYALSAMLGICSEEDDDAEAATNRNQPAARQATRTTVKPPTPPPASTDTSGAKKAEPPAVPHNIGEFLAVCLSKFKLNKTQVLEKLGVENLDSVNLVDAYQVLKEDNENRQGSL